MESELEDEKARMRAWYQSQLDEVAAKAKADYDAQLEALKEQLRQQVVGGRDWSMADACSGYWVN